MTPNQLTAAALVIQYWVAPEKVNPGVFIAIFLVTAIYARDMKAHSKILED